MIRGGVIAAIVLVVLGAASATPWVVTLQIPRLEPSEPPVISIPPITMPPQQPSEPGPAAQTIQTVLLVVLAVIVAAAVLLVLYRIVQRLREAWRPDDQQVDAEQVPGSSLLAEEISVDMASLATAVARAEAHLAGLAEPGDAVTAAWVALEDEAALQGTARDPAQTTTEFTLVLLQHTPAPAGAVSTLRRLYHKARFTTHPVTGDDVASARAALARIAAALDAAIPAVPPGEEA